MAKFNCLICEKELQEGETGPLACGYANMDFAYGSRFDQNGNGYYGDDDRLSQLLNCNMLRAYICDDCFEKKQNLFKGYRIEVERKYIDIDEE